MEFPDQNNLKEQDLKKSVANKDLSVKNLKETFEYLATLPPKSTEKPNWWIQQHKRGLDYITIESETKETTKSPINKLPAPTLAKFNSIILRPKEDKNLCISSKKRSSVVDDEWIPEFQGIDVTEIEDGTDVEDGQEAGEEVIAGIGNREILSMISVNRNSNDSDFSIDIASLLEKDRKQLSNVIQELIETEKIFVAHLEHGIDCYVTPFNDSVRNYPPLLGKKYHLFGNIEQLYAFHKDELLPSLTACNGDVIFIANIFYTFITNDHFYGYVLFGLTRTRAVQIAMDHKDFLKEMANESRDKLGLNSFLVKPTQRLGQYKLLFGEMIEALANDVDGIKNVKDLLSACCIVEKQLQRLLDNVNEALSLNDIEQTFEEQTSLLDLNFALFGAWSNLAELIPKPDGADFRLSLSCGVFDLLTQGKFRKMSVFTVYGSNVGRRFFGKTFLFEQTILCTEFIDYSTKLRYKTHISIDDISVIETVDKDTFKIVTKNKKITFFNSSLYVNDKWIDLLLRLKEKRFTYPKSSKRSSYQESEDDEWIEIQI